MANSMLTPTIIAKEALMQLENNCVMAKLVHRDYKSEFVKIGDTLSIRRPVKFVVTDGAGFVKQDVVEGNTTLVINKRKHVGWAFTTQELTLTIEEYSERYIKPAAIVLANQIDLDLLALYKDVNNWVGTPGQVVNSFSDFSKAPERLDFGAVPQDMRNAVMSTADHWGLLTSQTALFIQPVAMDAYRKARLGVLGGIDTWMDQNVATHTVGALGGTPVTNGTAGANSMTAAQYVSSGAKTTNTQSLITDGWTAAAAPRLKAGDVFTIATVFAVNPVSKAVTPNLQMFTVTADVSSDASGNLTAVITPPLVTSGPYQNVSNGPADGSAITIVGTASTAYLQNLVFHKNAFALVMVPLEMPDGVSFKARETHNSFSLRVIKTYDNLTDEEAIRIDVLYGVKTLYADLATRLSGTA